MKKHFFNDRESGNPIESVPIPPVLLVNVFTCPDLSCLKEAAEGGGIGDENDPHIQEVK
jgi:hypothetical protein